MILGLIVGLRQETHKMSLESKNQSPSPEEPRETRQLNVTRGLDRGLRQKEDTRGKVRKCE